MREGRRCRSRRCWEKEMVDCRERSHAGGLQLAVQAIEVVAKDDRKPSAQVRWQNDHPLSGTHRLPCFFGRRMTVSSSSAVAYASESSVSM